MDRLLLGPGNKSRGDRRVSVGRFSLEHFRGAF
jgi:hypothetical protein